MSLLNSLRSLLSADMRYRLQDLRSAINRLSGIDISAYDNSHPFARLIRVLRTHGITTVLDVGANTGQYAGHIRRNGFRGRIHSFEPLSEAFAVLQRRAAKDPLWTCHRYALGDKEMQTTIHISGNLASSSLLPMTSAHTDAVGHSAYTGEEQIEVKTLDSVLPQLCDSSERVFLKIDAQGFEEQILCGAEKSLSRLDFIQAELSFITLYDGEVLFGDFVQRMENRGYRIAGIDQSFTNDETGIGYQCDALFMRRSLDEKTARA